MGGYRSGPKPNNKTYAMYTGDELIAIGTEVELAEIRGVTVDTIRHLRTPSYIRRMKEKCHVYTFVEEINDEDEDEEYEDFDTNSKSEAFRSLAYTLRQFERESGDLLRSMKEAKT